MMKTFNSKLVLSLVLFPLLSYSDSFGVLSDSGIQGPPYEEIVTSLKKLEAENPGLAEVVVYGKSVRGRPLVSIRIGLKQKNLRKQTQVPAVSITGAHHGDEYLHIADRLPGWMLEAAKKPGPVSEYFKRGGLVYITPVFNPDGYETRSRTNANRKDLNRDYPLLPMNRPGFFETETKSYMSFLIQDLEKQNAKLRFAMDYHCCIGALLYPWSFRTKNEMPEKDLKLHQAYGEAIRKIFEPEKFKVGRTPDVLGYEAFGTSKDYYYAQFGAVSFTYEGFYGREDKYFDKHTIMWQMILSSLIKESQRVMTSR